MSLWQPASVTATRPTTYSSASLNQVGPQASNLAVWYTALPSDPIGTLAGGAVSFTDSTDKLVGVDIPGSVGDHVNLGDLSAVDFGSGNFSIVLWIKLDVLNSGRHIFVGKDTDTGRQFALEYDANADNTDVFRIAYYVSGASVFLDTSANFMPDTNLHHVVAQRNGSTFEIYRDAVLIASGTTGGTHGTMDATATPLWLGERGYPSFTEPINGKIFDVRFYSTALSAALIQELYAPATRWSLYKSFAALYPRRPGKPRPFAPAPGGFRDGIKKQFRRSS